MPHGFHGMVEIEHDRPLRQTAVLPQPCCQVVVADGLETQFAGYRNESGEVFLRQTGCVLPGI